MTKIKGEEGDVNTCKKCSGKVSLFTFGILAPKIERVTEKQNSKRKTELLEHNHVKKRFELITSMLCLNFRARRTKSK